MVGQLQAAATHVDKCERQKESREGAADEGDVKVNPQHHLCTDSGGGRERCTLLAAECARRGGAGIWVQGEECGR